jgi:hypothetical protein
MDEVSEFFAAYGDRLPPEMPREVDRIRGGLAKA